MQALSWEAAVETLRCDPAAGALVRACYYDDPLEAAAARFYASTEWAATRVLLPPAGRALELGAGRGIASCALARDGWQVTALEPNPGRIVGAAAIKSLAHDSALAIDVVEEWGEKLPFGDASFDLVYCRAVLHHARDLGELCSEAARVLKPNGMLCAVREHVISSHADLPAFLQAHPLHHLYGGEHAYLLVEYRDALLAAGFEIAKQLGPFTSDINLFPETMSGVRDRIASRLHLPVAAWIPLVSLRVLDWTSNAPGRHYSFIARKPEARR